MVPHVMSDPAPVAPKGAGNTGCICGRADIRKGEIAAQQQLERGARDGRDTAPQPARSEKEEERRCSINMTA